MNKKSSGKARRIGAEIVPGVFSGYFVAAASSNFGQAAQALVSLPPYEIVSSLYEIAMHLAVGVVGVVCAHKSLAARDVYQDSSQAPTLRSRIPQR